MLHGLQSGLLPQGYTLSCAAAVSRIAKQLCLGFCVVGKPLVRSVQASIACCTARAAAYSNLLTTTGTFILHFHRHGGHGTLRDATVPVSLSAKDPSVPQHTPGGYRHVRKNPARSCVPPTNCNIPVQMYTSIAQMAQPCTATGCQHGECPRAAPAAARGLCMSTTAAGNRCQVGTQRGFSTRTAPTAVNLSYRSSTHACMQLHRSETGVSAFWTHLFTRPAFQPLQTRRRPMPTSTTTPRNPPQHPT